MQQLDLLWRYQLADKEVADFENEMRQFPQRQQLLKLRNIVADQQTVVLGMENDANKALERLEELNQQKEKYAKLAQEITEKLEAETYETSAEVHKALSQLADAENRMKAAEKELSRMVGHSQMMVNRYKEVRLKASKARDEYTVLKQSYDVELARQTEKLDELKRVRSEAAIAVDSQIMERYKVLRTQCTPVVAKLNGDLCAGCNVSIPSAMIQALRDGAHIVECENCGRMLYIPE